MIEKIILSDLTFKVPLLISGNAYGRISTFLSIISPNILINTFAAISETACTAIFFLQNNDLLVPSSFF